MKKRITGLTGKLTLGVVIFGILLGAIISIIGYREFTSVLERQYNDSAYEIAETAAKYLNPDKFEAYLSTGQQDAEYLEIEKRLDDLVDATSTTLIYVAKVDTKDYRTLTCNSSKAITNEPKKMPPCFGCPARNARRKIRVFHRRMKSSRLPCQSYSAAPGL